MSPARLALAALGALALGGCASTAVKVPEVELPAAYEAKSEGPSAAQMNWREFFADPHLEALIAAALDGNHDLRVALQRIEIARAGVKQVSGVALPHVSVGAGAGGRKFGSYTMDGAGNATTDITPGRRVPVHYTDLSVGVQASWEADVWGKLQSLQASARASYLATIEGTRLVVTSLVADVALSYFELLALDHTSDVLTQSVEQQSQALEVMRLQKEAGRANDLAVRQFEVQLASTRAMEAAARQRSRQAEAQLNLLLGRTPRPIDRAKEALLRDAPTGVSLGVPSDLLRHRPDLREAELRVEASKFDVKAARAAFYPSLTLSAGAGYQAFDPRYLFVTPESLVYSAAAGLSAPLLNRREIEAQVEASKAAQIQAMHGYQGAILRAFVEVSSALVAVEQTAEVVAQKKQEISAASGAVEAADALFRAGKVTYLDVLLAQQKALDSRLALVDALKEQKAARVLLYRALGGGWQAGGKPEGDKADG